MRLTFTFLIITLCSLHSFSQTVYSETRTLPLTYTTTGAPKNWVIPYTYAMSGSAGATNLLTITNWGFQSIPSNALTITGVVFSFDYINPSNISITRVALVNSTGSSNDLVTTFLVPTIDGSYSFGSYNGLGTEWGNVGTGALTVADVTSAQFGVALDATKTTGAGTGRLEITNVSLTVYYTALLPVTLSKFDVSRINGDQVNVSWETTSEANVDKIYVERSSDGRNFNTLFELIPRGKINGSTAYQVTDKTPLSGTSFYRLREKELDGVNRIYPIQKITINSRNARFHTSYRQALIAVDLSGNDGSYQISVVNLNGQIISKTNMSLRGGVSHLDIDASAMKSGIYLINVSGNGIYKTERILVTH